MTDSGLVLAMDLSSHTGWAAGSPFARPVWGTWHLGKMTLGLGRMCSCLANELEAAITVHQPARVVFESPIVKHQTTARMLIYLCGTVEMVCFEHSIPCFEAASGTARKLVLGHGRPASPDTKRPKLPMIRWCEAQGWQVGDDDNAADALVLLAYSHLMARSRITAGAGSVAA